MILLGREGRFCPKVSGSEVYLEYDNY
jgi:hypothetical protein